MKRKAKIISSSARGKISLINSNSIQTYFEIYVLTVFFLKDILTTKFNRMTRAREKVKD